ncbi:cytochrome P450 [Xylariaceae sp. FL1272]|nr:cytochrome P450 [Xylariaceae sp. FL1272]
MQSSYITEAMNHLTVGQAALAATALFLSWYVTSAGAAWYRLRSIPGPLVASFSDMWLARTAYGGHMYEVLHENQNKHGEVVRIGPRAIAIYDPNTLWRINSARSTFSEPDTAKHDERKAKLTAGLGAPWGALADQRDHFDYLKMSETVLPVVQSVGYWPRLRSLFCSDWFLRLIGPKTTDKTGHGLFLGLPEKEVKRRRDGSQEKPGGGGFVMLGEWLPNGMSEADIQQDLAMQIPAGTETSVTVIRGLLLLLMSSPIVYQRLKQEIRDAITEGRISDSITNEEARNFPYLQAVVREGMRLIPPVAAGFPKIVPPPGDTICGKFIPTGTEVFPNFACLLRNPEVFGKDVNIFRPERFLSDSGDDPEVIARRFKTVDFIFGAGRWMCLGKNLAQTELNKIFLQLLRNFDFQIVNPETPWTRVAYTNMLISDFWVLLTEAKL